MAVAAPKPSAADPRADRAEAEQPPPPDATALPGSVDPLDAEPVETALPLPPPPPPVCPDDALAADGAGEEASALASRPEAVVVASGRDAPRDASAADVPVPVDASPPGPLAAACAGVPDPVTLHWLS
jgi:DNA polymerase-3 subunit gamma/tau